MKNLSRHTDVLCELETSLLMRGIQMGEMSILGRLIGLVKHVIGADFLYFLYLLLLLPISKILASSQPTV
jgi:membrane-anchored glycerophosphoryl diester phosphodiesterase (GDPDase)